MKRQSTDLQCGAGKGFFVLLFPYQNSPGLPVYITTFALHWMAGGVLAQKQVTKNSVETSALFDQLWIWN